MNEKHDYHSPPRTAERLFQRMFPDSGDDATIGDLAESFQVMAREHGLSRARHWYRWQVIRAFPVWLIDRCLWRITMLANYLKIAIRNLKRQRAYSIINITGLALGMACSLLIMIWVSDELTYDTFHEQRRDILRIYSRGKEADFFRAPAPLAPAAEQEIPEILTAVRVMEAPRFILSYEAASFYEGRGLVVDPAFLDIFSFPLKAGDAGSALAAPFNIVITESMASKYFGEEDPLGKSLGLEGRGRLQVSGVLRDIPANSHLRFDFLLPYRFCEVVGMWGKEWGDFNFRTYILAAPQRDDMEIARKLTALAESHGSPQVVHDGLTFAVQPLEKMYLNPLGSYDLPMGNQRYVYLFTVIAAFILLIACINFINLTTARSERRAREVGLRKVVGAGRSQILRQFFGESLMLSTLAMFLAVVMVRIMLPEFNALTGKSLGFSLLFRSALPGLVGVTLLTGILAGAYPALYLSSFNPVHVIRGGSGLPVISGNRGLSLTRPGTLRKILVVAQFSLSVILIIATTVVYHQLSFIKEKSWTLKEDAIVHFPFKENIASKYEVVRSQLLEHPDIISVGAKDCLPTTMINNTSGIGWEGKTQGQRGIHMETTRIDVGYFKTMGIEVKGRGFSSEFSGDAGSAFILSEKAVRLTGMEDPIGKRFRLYDTWGTIAGVVEDTYFQSMRQEMPGRLYHLFTNLPGQSFSGAVLIRIKGGTGRDSADAMAHIERVWKDVNRMAPFEIHFLDETIDAHYQREQRLGRLFTAFAFLAIFISCLGLMGLAAYVSEQKTKEIGIRKTVGASAGQIVLQLSRDFMRWVTAANLIAWPVAGYAMHHWLRSFPERASLTWWIFALAGVGSMVIAGLSVSFQTWRAAHTDPVKSLKYE